MFTSCSNLTTTGVQHLLSRKQNKKDRDKQSQSALDSIESYTVTALMKIPFLKE